MVQEFYQNKEESKDYSNDFDHFIKEISQVILKLFNFKIFNFFIFCHRFKNKFNNKRIRPLNKVWALIHSKAYPIYNHPFNSILKN